LLKIAFSLLAARFYLQALRSAVHAGAVGGPRSERVTLPAQTEEALMSALDLWSMAFVFLLATFVGLQVIQNVSRLLHTPLMSLTNAISAIAVVGSILLAGEQRTTLSTLLGTIAVAASVTNIVSGFLITDRMLRMFRDEGRKK
jgi:H+-translocating NAD(P) transhydrogenase subunit alpha